MALDPRSQDGSGKLNRWFSLVLSRAAAMWHVLGTGDGFSVGVGDDEPVVFTLRDPSRPGYRE